MQDIIPSVRRSRRLAEPDVSLPARIRCAALPARLAETHPWETLLAWRGPGVSALTVACARRAARAYAGAALRPFQARESYRLRLAADTCRIESETELGAFRALTTLGRILESYRDIGRRAIPATELTDWPALEYRGLMYDLARNQVHRQAHLLDVMRLCVTWKATHLHLYLEERFQYPSVPIFRGNPTFLSPAQARALDDWAQRNFLTLQPQRNCLGHNEGFLSRDVFRPLAEDPYCCEQLCPSQPAVRRHLAGTYRDLAAVFRSPAIHIGGDEAWELGVCPRCRRGIERAGADEAARHAARGALYLRHIRGVHRVIRRLGRQTALWGDMIKTHPTIAAGVPRDLLIYDWVYNGSDAASLRAFRDRGHRVVAVASDSGFAALGMDLRRATDNIERLFADATRLGLYGGELSLWEMEHGHFFHTALYVVAYALHTLWSGRRQAYRPFARRVAREVFGADTPVFGHLVRALCDELPRRLEALLRRATARTLSEAHVFARWDRLARFRKALFFWTADIPAKQSPFYHLIGLLTSPTYRPALWRPLATLVRGARRDLALLRRQARRQQACLAVYELAVETFDFNIWLALAIKKAERSYARAARAQVGSRAGWARGLAPLRGLTAAIIVRYRRLLRLQAEACRRYGHPKRDVACLREHIALARVFQRQLGRLARSREPLPSFYRLLLEYPLRDF